MSNEQFDVYRRYAEKMLLAERVQLMGDARIQEVWFDNVACKLYIPDALDDRIQSLILSTGRFFEEGLLRKIKPHVSRGSTVLDIGANIGNHTVFFSAVCGAARVMSFEPQKRVFEILRRNAQLNTIGDRKIDINNIGLGNRTQKLKVVHENVANMGATQFAYDEDGGFDVKRLDDLGLDHVDFIKIDVERMGHEVLAGARNLIEKSKPKIWIELYDVEIEPAKKILSDLGYTHTVNLTGADHLFSTTPL